MEEATCLSFTPISAGFPSPAEIWAERSLSLDEVLLAHPEATYFVRVRGHSMTGAGIFDQDLLIVDRALPATHNSVVIAQVETGFLVKRLLLQGERVILKAEHPAFPPFEVGPHRAFAIWGVVLFAIHAMHPAGLVRLSPLAGVKPQEDTSSPP